MTSHVLVLVDDSDDHRFITVTELRRLKTSQSFTIEEASRGEDALQSIDRLVRSGSNILVLADYRMPRMTGLDLVRAIRTRHPTRNIRLVIYSSTDQGLAEEAQRAGADEFIVKPMDLQQFRAAVQRLIGDWFSKAAPTTRPPRRTI